MNIYDSNEFMNNQNNNLIYSQEKIFFYEDTRFLWKELIRINTSLIIKSKEISSLEPYVQNLLYSKLNPDDVDLLSKEYVVQLVTLLQLTGQYLVYIQKRLSYENEELKERLNELEEYSKRAENVQSLIESLNKKNQEQDFLIKTYQKMIIKGNSIDNKNMTENNIRSKKEGKVYCCKICSGKKFRSKKYLDEHMKRRHFNERESEREYQDTRDSYSHKEKNLKEQLDSLKEYVVNRIKLDYENNDINLLNKKIDSLKNQIIIQNNNRNINLYQNGIDLNNQNLNTAQKKQKQSTNFDILNKEVEDLREMFINEAQLLNAKIKNEKNNLMGNKNKNENENKYNDNKNINLNQINKKQINKEYINKNVIENNKIIEKSKTIEPKPNISKESNIYNNINNKKEEEDKKENVNNDNEKDDKRYSNANKEEEMHNLNENNNNNQINNDNNNINNQNNKDSLNNKKEQIESNKNDNNNNENQKQIEEIKDNFDKNNLENEQNNLRAQNFINIEEKEKEPEDNIYKKENETKSPRFSKIQDNELNDSKKNNYLKMISFEEKVKQRDNDFYQLKNEYEIIDIPSEFNADNEKINEKIEKILENSKEFNENNFEEFIEDYEEKIKKNEGKDIYKALGIDKILNDCREYFKEKNNLNNNDFPKGKRIIQDSTNINISQIPNTINVEDSNNYYSRIKESNLNQSNALTKSNDPFKKDKNKNIFESSINLLEENMKKEDPKQSIHKNIITGFDLTKTEI